MSPPIEALGAIGFLGGGAAVRYDRQGAFVPDLLAHFFAIVGLIRRDSQWRSRRVEYLFDDLAVVDLTARHREAQWSAPAVDNRVDFRGSATPADADRLISLPPFPPLAAR